MSFSVGSLVFAAASGTASGREADLWSQLRPADPAAGKALQRALTGAARRLAEPSCQKVLSDFHDQRGRPLQARLAELDVAPARYLGRIRFQEGWPTGECSGNDRLAFTRPGSDVVWVCGARFEHAAKANARWAEATLIHEALHTLGLGENGSASSLAITRRVLERCGR